MALVGAVWRGVVFEITSNQQLKGRYLTLSTGLCAWERVASGMSIIPCVKKFQSKATVCVCIHIYIRSLTLSKPAFLSYPLISLYQTSSCKVWGQKVIKSQSSERDGMKQYLLDTTGPLYLWTHNFCGCLHKTCTRPTQSTFQHAVGNGLWVPTAGWGAMTADGYWGRESQFSLWVWSLLGWPSTSGWPHTHSYAGKTSTQRVT